MKTRIISAIPSGYGHKKVTIEYRNKLYSAVTNNMPLYDAYNSDTVTVKQEKAQKRAEKELIRWVKTQNNLR